MGSGWCRRLPLIRRGVRLNDAGLVAATLLSVSLFGACGGGGDDGNLLPGLSLACEQIKLDEVTPFIGDTIDPRPDGHMRNQSCTWRGQTSTQASVDLSISLDEAAANCETGKDRLKLGVDESSDESGESTEYQQKAYFYGGVDACRKGRYSFELRVRNPDKNTKQSDVVALAKKIDQRLQKQIKSSSGGLNWQVDR